MRVIYKYEVTTEPDMQLPVGAKILTVGTQDLRVYLWAIVNPQANTETRRISYIGTGHTFSEENRRPEYIGTVHLPEVGLVWHIFEEM